jgi:hypothetical protein
VSRAWGGELVPFFESNGYGYAGGSYGSPFNGYMGVCVAWPRDKHQCLDVVRTTLPSDRAASGSTPLLPDERGIHTRN